MTTPPTRTFRALRWLRRRHGLPLRLVLAVLAGALVGLLTGRGALLREAAGLFWRDRFKLGAHRLHWYLAHGWTARALGVPPLFDPTTGMNPATVQALADWLGDSPDHRLARLYVLARQLPQAADQDAVLDAFCATATGLVAALPARNPEQTTPAQTARFTLGDAKAALTATGVLDAPWYIISGTFLGAVREGAFLAHDYDVDIGIHAEDFDEPAFLATMQAAPDLVLVNRSDHQELTKAGGRWQAVTRPALFRVLHASGIGIDVFIHHRDGDLRWHGSAKHRWDNTEFDLAEYEISGLPVRGPADADRYLTENYGAWRVPVKSFSCSTGTPNVSFPRNLAALAEHLRQALHASGQADGQIARLVLETEGYLTGGVFALPWQRPAAP